MLKSSGQYLCYRFSLICCRNSDIGKVSVCFCSIRSVSQRIEVQPFGNFLRFSISIGNFKRCGCAVRKSDRVCVHIAVRGSLYNGNNTDSGVTLVTLVAFVALVTLVTFVALFSLFTLDTLRSFHTLAPGQNRYSHEYG